MRKRDIRGEKFMCVGVEFLDFNVLLRINLIIVIGKNLLKTGFSVRNILKKIVSFVFIQK